MIKNKARTAPPRGRRQGSNSLSTNPTSDRPRNAGETRAALLGAARMAFAVDGFEGTSLRSIARYAGVDVALISRYFGSKSGLFQAVISFESNRVTSATDGSPAQVAERLLSNALADPMEADYDLLITILRSSQNPAATKSMRQVLEILETNLAKLCDAPDKHLRAALMSAMLIGIAVQRRLLHKQPLSSVSVEELLPLFRQVLSRVLPTQRKRTATRLSKPE